MCTTQQYSQHKQTVTNTCSRLLVVGLLSIAEALCTSLYLFGRILVTLCLMVWDWRVSGADPMISCAHDLLFLFCLLLFYLLLPSMGWLCGVGVFGLIECSHSLPALHSGLQIIIIIIIEYRDNSSVTISATKTQETQ